MLLPPIQRTGEIHFHVAKSLPYPTRLALAFALMAAGLIVQGVMLAQGPWGFGAALLFLGVLLLLPQGYTNNTAAKTAGDWRPVRRQEVERIIEIDRQQKRWDSDAFDLTSGKGFGLLLLIGVLAYVGLGYLRSHGAPQRTLFMITVNTAVMIVPFWLTGVRFILKNDKLIVKTQMFLDMERHFDRMKKEGEEFGYQLQTAAARGEGGEVPRDVKALVSFHNGPKEFLGLQMQVALNSVQGKDYPYFYCVLVGREALAAVMEKAAESTVLNLVVDPRTEGDVYIVVIRQATSKNTGYHTNLKAAKEIFDFALGQARRIAQAQ